MTFMAESSSATLPTQPALLKAREFDQIRELAYQYCGLDIHPGKEELVAARLGKLLRKLGMTSFRQYYEYVTADASGPALVEMIDALTTNHTSFFREPQHFEFLSKTILPALANRSKIEIWSAACSTGEEPYSLAIALLEHFASTHSPDIRIMATDISTRAIAAGELAVYPEERLHGMEHSLLKKHFLRGQGESKGLCRLNPGVRRLVQFQRLNLMEPFPSIGTYPLILCRNVMIYFDAATQEHLVRRLSQQLEPGGYLFIGHSESLNGIAHPLKYVRPAIYRKSGDGVTVSRLRAD
jgi:chemotaxis protein methyltransferase CheR